MRSGRASSGPGGRDSRGGPDRPDSRGGAGGSNSRDTGRQGSREGRVRRWQRGTQAQSGAGKNGLAGRFAARARQRRRNVWISLSTALVVVILGSGTGWLVYGTGVLDIRSVSVEGSQTVPPEQVLAAAKVPLGTPLARLDTGGIRARVGALRPVAAVEVFRSWPHTVTVRIVERRPVAVVVQNSGYGLLDAEGVLYGSTSARPTGLPFVRLLDPGPGDRATRAVLAVVGVLTPELRHQLVEITAPTAEQVTLVLARGRSVFWGDAQDSSRKATVATALLARPGTRIDVSAADVVTVK